MKIILYLLAIAALFIFYVRYLEKNSLFYPTGPLAETPADYGLAFEDVTFASGDSFKLHGWYVPADQAKSTLLFFHGNAGNIGDRMGKVLLFHRLGFNILIIDYRGYGKSEGRPSEKGMYEDAMAAYGYLVEDRNVPSERIVVYGASLGGAAAVDLASKRTVGGLIIDSSFTSAVDMAKRIYPFIPSFLVSLKLDSVSKISKVKAPVLFLHSPQDEIVPVALGRKLFAAAPAPKRFVELSGGHNDNHFIGEREFVEAVSAFMKENDL